ncbi:McrB family protein [Helicobacter suis]|uniref:McrB family protein n=1 Tax=Helicobacter suis TaxID=104628 RepID=UPI00249270DE|nr:AAA family ATPase [Helicobacter suis]
MGIEWDLNQRRTFQGLLREFVELVDEKVDIGKQTGKPPECARYKDIRDRFNIFLQEWGYECAPNLGQRYLPKEPGIAFLRQNVLGEGFVNSKATTQEGFYIWFAYAWEEPSFYLHIGRSTNNLAECKKCTLYPKVFGADDKVLRKYSHLYTADLESELDGITDDFLRLMDQFNEFPPEDFKPTATTPKAVSVTTPSKVVSMSSLKIPLNQIFYGPPGTGKTYMTINKALEIILDKQGQELELEIKNTLEALKPEVSKTIQAEFNRETDDIIRAEKINRARAKALFDYYKEQRQIDFVTFHQSYSYEEFVEGIKPKMLDGQVCYEIKDGIFKQICKKAKDAQKFPPEKPYILIIDEINRGNIAKIFGELITLIEPSKRIGNEESLEVTLPYSGDYFGVPNNLYIIATINTADSSIALLDIALRRRFSFVEMMPKPALLSTNCSGVDLQKLLKAINERIEFLLDQDHSIGHAYFLGLETLQDLQDCFKNKIIPLLQEYFYDDHAKIDAVLNKNGMLKPKSLEGALQNLLNDFVDPDKKIYTLTEASEWKAEYFIKIYGKKEEAQTPPVSGESVNQADK